MSAIRRPPAFRLINTVGPYLSRLGVGRIDLAPEALEERACRQTGLSDFGNSHYQETFARFVDSLHRDGDMHYLGKMAMRDLVTIRLATRLKTTELLKTRPDLAEGGSPKSPVFIIGTMRSGTTLLFNLFVQDQRFRATELWETLDPMPPVSIADPLEVEKRIANMQKLLGPYNQMLPELRQVHCLDNARQPEEDYGILESTFMAGSWAFLMWNGPSYYTWLIEQSVDRQAIAVREYAQIAQMLMHGHEGKTWLSKAPTEAPLLPSLATVFPDARIIHTHRDPRQRVPSTASLMRTFHSMYVDPDLKAVGRQALAYDEFAQRGIAATRDLIPPERTIDIDYEDLVRDPIACVEQTYDRLGFEATEEHRTRMDVWLANKNQYDPKHAGRHQYEASDFGLDDGRLERLAP